MQSHAFDQDEAHDNTQYASEPEIDEKVPLTKTYCVSLTNKGIVGSEIYLQSWTMIVLQH